MQFPAGLVRENRDAEGMKRQLEEMTEKEEGFCFLAVNDKASLQHVTGFLVFVFWTLVLFWPRRVKCVHTTLVMANHLDVLPKPQQQG